MQGYRARPFFQLQSEELGAPSRSQRFPTAGNGRMSSSWILAQRPLPWACNCAFPFRKPSANLLYIVQPPNVLHLHQRCPTATWNASIKTTTDFLHLEWLAPEVKIKISHIPKSCTRTLIQLYVTSSKTSACSASAPSANPCTKCLKNEKHVQKEWSSSVD